MISKANSSKSESAKGATLLEMAIGLPVLLILLMGTIDLGLALDQYLSVSRATYEGLRYGAGLYDNQVGCVGYECEQAKSAATTDSAKVNLRSIEGRINKILVARGYVNPKLTMDIEKETQIEGGNEYTYNVIKTTVEVPYIGLLPFFKFIPMKISISFTDLYRDDVEQLPH